MQNGTRRRDLRDNRSGWTRRCCNRCGRTAGAAALDHLLDRIALLLIQAAELVLNVETGLVAEIEKILRLNV
jgi:hypothetical protein